MTKNQLWRGRFSEVAHRQVQQFNQSHSVDRRLYKYDIAGSKVHTKMLERQKIISAAESRQIIDGLDRVQESIESDDFEWRDDLEDVHMHIESALIEDIGDIGKKLHTGRSRNDQVALDIRLWLRDNLEQICRSIHTLQQQLLAKADEYSMAIMPSFTHLQFAMPTLVGHHLMAWFEMLERDYQRFIDCRQRLNQCPLGSAALVGTSFDIDREWTSAALKFDRPTNNSIDSVSDRDFAIEFTSAASICMLHLSRMSEEIIYWMSTPLSWLQLPDALCTGSSIMPQKKNPDMAELIRGKSAKVIGSNNSLQVLMKGQPLAYNKDNQEDKALIFDCTDNTQQSLEIMALLVQNFQFDTEAMLRECAKGYLTATDLAEYLVKKGVAFRDAHHITGLIVAQAQQRGCQLSDLTLEQLQSHSVQITDDIYSVLDVENTINTKNHIGGTAKNRVAAAIKQAHLTINDHFFQ